ncbi:anti-sigma factor antagonist [Eubacterium xylanophilum]|uniref:anti-sigma factor antagonist n=1 Tax=Eubacterium xylanophilum TaxID=39497 RepID=UPI00047A7C73|nr:anti-sigma factor antagonist [Eubacterium xylanophilum]
MNKGNKTELFTVELSGRIDSSNAAKVEKELIASCEEHLSEDITVDASNLEYISSAGLRVLMKLRKKVEGTVTINEVSPEVYDIFKTTGFTELFDIKKRMREISVEGCEVIGEGGNGIVYRKDDETIVKMYYGDRNGLEKINRNREISKNVFLKGIPTAIAFDTVKIGENYGVVYEMIKAKSMMQEMSEHPKNLDQYANMIVDTLIKLHNTELNPGDLQDARDNVRKDIRDIEECGLLTDAERDRLFKLVDDIPARNTFIHQDFHPGNMMMLDGEIVLIDVEDSGMGHPVLDLSSMYIVYVTAAKSGWTKKDMGLGAKEFGYVWDIILRKYFNTNDANEIKEINRILRGYSQIKYIRGVATSPRVPNFLRKVVVKQAKKKLFNVIDTLHPIP